MRGAAVRVSRPPLTVRTELTLNCNRPRGQPNSAWALTDVGAGRSTESFPTTTLSMSWQASEVMHGRWSTAGADGGLPPADQGRRNGRHHSPVLPWGAIRHAARPATGRPSAHLVDQS